MQLNFTASMAILLAVFPHGAFSETIAGASYKSVCKKMEQEGVASRTQSGGEIGEIPANVVVLYAGSSHSLRGNSPLASSNIIVGANVTQISTQTNSPDDKPASANTAVNACE